MDESNIVFKATANGLILIMGEEDSFEGILEQVEKKLASAGKFFKGSSLTVKYRGRKLSEKEAECIARLMEEKTGAQINSFEEDNEEPEKPAAIDEEQARRKLQVKKFFFSGIHEGMAKFYRGTVRSGQHVRYDGNLVVIGDVNPGGEVEATGNVIVMGSLRGMVHAGSDGNKEAIVVAFNLQPMQLRIASIITRSPDVKEARGAMVPELAYVRDDMVYIERFLPQR